MKHLTNRAGSFLTGTEIADAVMQYALQLARQRDVDLVEIPFVAADGAIRRVELTIGWLADLVAVSDGRGSKELVEHATVDSIRAKADSVGVLRASPFSGDDLERMRSGFVEPAESY
jgi:hypothetical protein